MSRIVTAVWVPSIWRSPAVPRAPAQRLVPPVTAQVLRALTWLSRPASSMSPARRLAAHEP